MNNNQSTKAMGLISQVAKGLLTHATKDTAAQLGNRSLYIGMSDIGKGAECLRTAVGNKLYGIGNPQPDDIISWYQQQEFESINAALKKQLVLQRGHWLEGGIQNALSANGASYLPQLEIEVVLDDNTPIKAHLDFILVSGGDKPTVRVLELKSTENIPDKLYTAYEVQLYGQLGFLYRYWSEPCFNVRSPTGKILYERMTFPDLIYDCFGITLPASPESVDIEGWLLALAMSKAKAFGPYVPDSSMFSFCSKTAKQIWALSAEVSNGTTDINTLDYCKGFHPLCDYCSHASDCPKFNGLTVTDSKCNDALSELRKLKDDKKELEADIKAAESRIKQFYHSCNTQEWLSTADFKFKCYEMNGRVTLNKETLTTELISLLGQEQAELLLDKHTTQSAPSERLLINRNNSN